MPVAAHDRPQPEILSASYYRARYYDPSVGRFLSEDPLEFRAGTNSYRYVGNRVVNDTDPGGLFPTGRDKWYGHNDPAFQWWWHRCYWKNMPYDGTKEDIEFGWDVWNALGRPQYHCGGSPQTPCEEKEKQPAPAAKPTPGPNSQPLGAPLLPIIIDILEDLVWLAAA